MTSWMRRKRKLTLTLLLMSVTALAVSGCYRPPRADFAIGEKPPYPEMATARYCEITATGAKLSANDAQELFRLAAGDSGIVMSRRDFAEFVKYGETMEHDRDLCVKILKLKRGR